MSFQNHFRSFWGYSMSIRINPRSFQAPSGLIPGSARRDYSRVIPGSSWQHSSMVFGGTNQGGKSHQWPLMASNGPSRPEKNDHSARPQAGRKSWKIMFHCFFHELFAKIGPRASGVPSWSSWQSMDVFRQHPAHLVTILHFSFFWKKDLFKYVFKYFLFVHVFLNSGSSGTLPRL